MSIFDHWKDDTKRDVQQATADLARIVIDAINAQLLPAVVSQVKAAIPAIPQIDPTQYAVELETEPIAIECSVTCAVKVPAIHATVQLRERT